MRQEDEADKVEKTCYESHCEYAVGEVRLVGSWIQYMVLCCTFSDAGLKVERRASARA